MISKFYLDIINGNVDANDENIFLAEKELDEDAIVIEKELFEVAAKLDAMASAYQGLVNLADDDDRIVQVNGKINYLKLLADTCRDAHKKYYAAFGIDYIPNRRKPF